MSGLRRRFCRGCLQLRVPAITERHDRRTKWEVLADRPANIGVFHYCAECARSRSARQIVEGSRSAVGPRGAVAS